MPEAKYKSRLIKRVNITAVILLLTSPLYLKLQTDSPYSSFFLILLCHILFSSSIQHTSLTLQLSSFPFPYFFYFASQAILNALNSTLHAVYYPFTPLLEIHGCGSGTRNTSLRNKKLLRKTTLSEVALTSKIS